MATQSTDNNEYCQLDPSHFEALIVLANQVHGDNYLNYQQLSHYYQLGIKNEINASWVAIQNGRLVGFRLTFAPQQWDLDQWCSTVKWPCQPQQVCYFKCTQLTKQCAAKALAQPCYFTRNSVKQQGGSLVWLYLGTVRAIVRTNISLSGGKIIKQHPGSGIYTALKTVILSDLRLHLRMCGARDVIGV